MNSFLYLGDALTCRASALHWHFNPNPRFGEMLAPSFKTVHWTVLKFTPCGAPYGQKRIANFVGNSLYGLTALLSAPGISLIAMSDRGSASGHRKPLKRLDLNFCIYLSDL